MDQTTDHLPKLMPLWHDQSTHDMISSDRRFLGDNLPDYGGIGVDISLKENKSLHSIVKHAADCVHFQAQTCALPFLPANKVPMGTDPCLSSLNTSRENCRRFCIKLETLRIQMKTKRCENFRKEILNTYQTVQKMCKSGNFSKVLLPEILIELATIFPKTIHDENLNYFDCLASCNKASENPILLYPTGKKLNKLAVISLEHSSDLYKTFQPVDSQKNEVKLDSGCIQQIKCAFNGYCYVLQDKKTHFIDFNDLSSITHFACLAQKNVTNIGASHYCPDELISTHENGMMEMFNVDKKKMLWSVKNSEFSEGFERSVPLSCSFGSHPKSVLCITNRKLHSFDLRSKDNKGCVIFSSYHPSCYRNEYLTCMKGLLINPFQYFISSSHHLFLCDERYPNKPVLLWNHLLKTSPLYCDVTSYNTTASSDVSVLLGTQKSQELVSFSVNANNSSLQPTVSLGPPLFLSSPSDCVNSLKFHCADISEDIAKRLSCPLVGVTTVPHNNKAGFTAFQITSPGDVFYQDFKTDLSINSQNVERTYRVDMGCVLIPPSNIWPSIRNWSKDCKKNEIHDDADAYCINRIHVDLKDFLCKQSEISSECSVCAFYKLGHNRDIISSESCPTCGLEDLESEHLIKASNEMSLLVGPTTEDCDLSEFDATSFFQFTDTYGKKILQAWSYLEEEDRLGNAEMQSQEYNFDDALETFSLATSYNTPVKNSQLPPQDISNISSQLHLQTSASFMDETMADVSLYNFESIEEFVPPSQETRPLVGETLRTPRQIKAKLSKKVTSSAGF